MILADGFHSILLYKYSVVFKHLLNILSFLVLVMSMELDTSEADKLSCPDVLLKDCVNRKQTLHSNLVIVCIVYRNARVTLPD